jgi:hypothetical protein
MWVMGEAGWSEKRASWLGRMAAATQAFPMSRRRHFDGILARYAEPGRCGVSMTSAWLPRLVCRRPAGPWLPRSEARALAEMSTTPTPCMPCHPRRFAQPSAAVPGIEFAPLREPVRPSAVMRHKAARRIVADNLLTGLGPHQSWDAVEPARRDGGSGLRDRRRARLRWPTTAGHRALVGARELAVRLRRDPSETSKPAFGTDLTERLDASEQVYLAPEALSVENPDGVAMDVFSLGAPAFLPLAGQRPSPT